MGQDYMGYFLVKYWPRQIQTTLYIIFFVQICLWSKDQHCTGNFLVQCCPRQIKTTLQMVIFLRKNEYMVWLNIAQ